MSSVISIAVILVAGVLVLVAVAALVCVVWFRRRKECKRREKKLRLPSCTIS